jgi:hypothetical protein
MSLPSPQTKKLKVSNNLTPSVNPNLVNLTRKEPGLDDTTNIQYHYRVGPCKHGQSSIMSFFDSVQRGAPTPSAKKEVDNMLDNASKGGSGKGISIRPDHKKITDEKQDAEDEHVGDDGYDEEEDDFDDATGDVTSLATTTMPWMTTLSCTTEVSAASTASTAEASAAAPDCPAGPVN